MQVVNLMKVRATEWQGLIQFVSPVRADLLLRNWLKLQTDVL